MKILIIEDNLSNMKLVSNLLKMSGYETLHANNAESGISIAREKLPALILMDIVLPGMDGLTAARVLKGDNRTEKIPVIAVTSLAMKSDNERVREEGFDAYITKPFDYKEFLETVKFFITD